MPGQRWGTPRQADDPVQRREWGCWKKGQEAESTLEGSQKAGGADVRDRKLTT